TPEFVSATVIHKAAESWKNLPATIGHPKGADGKQCSVTNPGMAEAHGFGKIRSAVAKGKKLVMEVLADVQRLKDLKQEKLLTDLREEKPVEVSVGAFVLTNNKESKFGDKNYKGEWMEAIGDHIAFLPGGRGACSLDMGCG